MKKFYSTVKIAYSIIMARTFGEYLHSAWDGQIEYARYKWKNKEWIIPLGCVGWNKYN